MRLVGTEHPFFPRSSIRGSAARGVCVDWGIRGSAEGGAVDHQGRGYGDRGEWAEEASRVGAGFRIDGRVRAALRERNLAGWSIGMAVEGPSMEPMR